MNLLDLNSKVRGKTIKSESVHIRPRVIKTCNCGVDYTLSEFWKLSFRGRWPTADKEEPGVLENRLCTCGTTLSVWFNPDGSVNIEETNA